MNCTSFSFLSDTFICLDNCTAEATVRVPVGGMQESTQHITHVLNESIQTGPLAGNTLSRLMRSEAFFAIGVLTRGAWPGSRSSLGSGWGSVSIRLRLGSGSHLIRGGGIWHKGVTWAHVHEVVKQKILLESLNSCALAFFGLFSIILC